MCIGHILLDGSLTLTCGNGLVHFVVDFISARFCVLSQDWRGQCSGEVLIAAFLLLAGVVVPVADGVLLMGGVDSTPLVNVVDAT